MAGWGELAHVAEAAEGAVAGAGVAGGVVLEFAEGVGAARRIVVGDGGAGGLVQVGVGNSDSIDPPQV